MSYSEFIAAKAVSAPRSGFDVSPEDVNPILKPHQSDMVRWAVAGGRRALFSAFGIGKTVVQLEAVRLTLLHAPSDKVRTLDRPFSRGLIILPLGVRNEFMRDAAMLGMSVKFIRSIDEAQEDGIYLTNYETVREGKLDPRQFTVVSLDEASCLRGFGGTKTFREFMRLFEGSGVYRYVATATPSPNDFIELLAYAAFLEIMDVGQAKTRFFKRDSTNADNLTIHPHKEDEFWQWVSSWALFVSKPGDLGHSDEGYELPPLQVHWHELPSDHSEAGRDRDGQNVMFKDTSLGVIGASHEKRRSLPQRVSKVVELVDQAAQHVTGDDQVVIWCDLNDEQDAIEVGMQQANGGKGFTYASLRGAQSIDERDILMDAWRSRERHAFISKPTMYGAGVNLQQAHTMVFAGIGFKAQDILQAIHREYRFLQKHQVHVHFIYTEAERGVRASLERKWSQHNELVANMTGLIREHGLANLGAGLKRSVGIDRQVATGKGWTLANNDAVLEARSMEADSVGLIITSIPFSNQYEYSPSYNDFGHTDDNAHFWEQMDYLVPELLRVLQPGRVAAIHVKDRITPSGITGMGFQTVQPFSDECTRAFTKHGFGFLARKTIVTDVVRENNQTYRLGWSEQCKDGSRMGAGMPEYLLIFRKPPTDTSNGYADVPVVKEKPLCDDNGAPAPFDKETNWKNPIPGTGYSRARWQFDAHGFTRSSGDRLLSSDELAKLPHEKLFKLWRERSTDAVYSFEGHAGVAEEMDRLERLPSTFMLFPPHSWHPDVWTDITRMRTLNSSQAAKGKEAHLCLATGSLVLTNERGYVPIEGVIVGESVLTHKGRWRKVQVVRNTGVQPVVKLHAQGVPSLMLTPDHELWTRSTDWVRERDGAERATPGWLRADQTVGAYVNLKLPPVVDVPLTEEECWLLGRWLADGHVATHGDFIVSIGPDKLEEFERVAGNYCGGRHVGSAVQIRLKGLSAGLILALRACGRGAGEKHIPAELLALPVIKADALLNGYLSGDGHYVEGRATWMATSVSRALLLGMAMIAQRVHGAIASVRAGRGPGTAVIEGRTVNTRQEWVMSFSITGDSRKQPFLMDDGAWKKVRNTEPVEPVETWCLRVEEDESFTAEGCIVKNCPLQFDIVDRAIIQYTNEGEVVYDPFMGIGTVAHCALKLKRQAHGSELNPRYWIDSVMYARQAEITEVPSLFDVIETEAAT